MVQLFAGTPDSMQDLIQREISKFNSILGKYVNSDTYQDVPLTPFTPSFAQEGSNSKCYWGIHHDQLIVKFEYLYIIDMKPGDSVSFNFSLPFGIKEFIYAGTLVDPFNSQNGLKQYIAVLTNALGDSSNSLKDTLSDELTIGISCLPTDQEIVEGTRILGNICVPLL